MNNLTQQKIQAYSEMPAPAIEHCNKIMDLSYNFFKQNEQEELEATISFLGMLDELLYEDINKPDITPSCKRGCSFCCYLFVRITVGEAKLLATHVTEDMLPILREQAQYVDSTEWEKLQFKK